MPVTTETLTDAQKLEMIRFLAEEAKEHTKDHDTWSKEYWLLRNALGDILSIANHE